MKKAQLRLSNSRMSIILFASFLALLAACGGGGGGGNGRSDEGDDTVDALPVSGQAVLGPLAGATVYLFAYPDLSKPIHTTTTVDSADLASTGQFKIPGELLEKKNLYILAVLGGNDIDADDDGTLDATPTVNNGTIHLAASGAQLKSGDFKVNILTEVLYQKVAYLIMARYTAADILATLDQYISALIREDVNGDGDVDMVDILAFSPAAHKGIASKGWPFWQACINAIHSGDVPFARFDQVHAHIIAELELGTATDVAIRGSSAYVVGKGLNVVDISDPHAPVVVGEEDRVGGGIDVNLDISDDYAFIANGINGIQVVDISDAGNPILIGGHPPSVGSTAKNVFVKNAYAFVAAKDGGVEIFDVSNPQSIDPPVVVETEYPTHAVWVNNHRLYTVGDGNMQIFDVSEPSDPHFQIEITNSYGGLGLEMVDGYAYLVGAGQGLQVVDLLVPANPFKAGSASTIQEGVDICINRDNAFVAEAYSGVEIFDIHDKTAPISLGTIDTGDYTYGVEFADPYLYVAANRAGLLVIDPGGDLVNHAVVTGIPDIQIGRLDSNSGYLFGTTIGGRLHIFRIGDPARTDLIRTYDVPGADSVRNVLLVDDHAYVVDSDQLFVLDISTPQSGELKIASEDSHAEYDLRPQMAVAGDRIVVSNSDNGIEIFDISKPSSPIRRGHFTPVDSDFICDMVISGDYAYLAASDNGVVVIDIGNPDNPVESTRINVGDAMSLAIYRDFAYVGLQNGNLKVVDISNLAAPLLCAEVELPEQAERIVTDGTIAYVVLEDTGVCVLDITHPALPGYKGMAHTLNNAQDISVANGHVFLSDSQAGLQVLRAIQNVW